MSPKRSEIPASSIREASSRHVLTRAMQFPLRSMDKGRDGLEAVAAASEGWRIYLSISSATTMSRKSGMA